MLGRVPQETLERAARDPRYLALYRRACETQDAYMAAQSADSSDMLVAYFSMEYGLLDCMPIYSGGLGVLSGDHLKASSDAILPLVGLGLLYQRGYFRQSLDANGWQQERTPVNDFYSLPITPATARGRQRADRGRAGRGNHRVPESLADRSRARAPVSDGQQHPEQRRPVSSRHHRPALRRRPSQADLPGNRSGDRRTAGAEGARASARPSFT